MGTGPLQVTVLYANEAVTRKAIRGCTALLAQLVPVHS